MKKLILLLVLISVVFVYAWLVYFSKDIAIIYNDTGNEITVYPVYVNRGYGDVDAKIQKSKTGKVNAVVKIRHDGIFIIKVNDIFFKYAAGFVSWDVDENIKYGDFNKRKFQIDKDGLLFVLLRDEKAPMQSKVYQPAGFPIKPDKIKELKDFKIYLRPTSM